MRTASRLAFTAAVLGGGLLFAGPAAAEDVCPYPMDENHPACAPISGGSGEPATDVDNSPVRHTAGGGSTLPFTGGEVTLIALAGTAALGGGVVLVAAGRKRATV